MEDVERAQIIILDLCLLLLMPLFSLPFAVHFSPLLFPVRRFFQIKIFSVLFKKKKRYLQISACLAVSRTQGWLRACCWNNDLAQSCSWRNKRTMPRILTFAGGFATSVSSNSSHISSLCAVMDGNIWLKIAEAIIWSFRWKLFIGTEALCARLSKNTWNKPKIILKAHECSLIWQLPPQTKLVQPQLGKTHIPSFPAFTWQQFLLAGCCCQGRQKGCAAGFSFTCT